MPKRWIPQRKDAEAKAEPALKEQAVALKTALDAKDRKAIGAAAGKMEAAAKEVKDKDFQKKAAKLAADIKGDAGATVAKVFAGDNLMKALYLFIGFAILGVIGMAFMGMPVGKFIAGFPIVFILSALAYFVSDNDIVKYYGLEVVFWALIFGLLISNIFGVPDWLKTGHQDGVLHQDRSGPPGRRGPLRHHRQGGRLWDGPVHPGHRGRLLLLSLVRPQGGTRRRICVHSRRVRVDLRRLGRHRRRRRRPGRLQEGEPYHLPGSAVRHSRC